MPLVRATLSSQLLINKKKKVISLPASPHSRSHLHHRASMSPTPGLLKSLEKDSPAALTLQHFHGMEVTGYERSRDGDY